MATDFDRHQAELQERRWTWDDMPFYDGPGTRPPIAKFHDLDYLDVYEKVYGRRIGANGIGRLREVAITRVAETTMGNGSVPHSDLQLARRQQDDYADVLAAEGVEVHWIEPAESPVSTVDRMRAPWAAHDLLILNGGAVVPRSGQAGDLGGAAWLAHWAFWNLNIPTLLTISGTGIAEAGATRWLAQDVYVVGLSRAYDEDGLGQLLSTVRATAGVDELEVVTVRCQGNRYWDPDTGATAQVTNLIASLDVDKVLCWTPGIDSATLLWLQRNGYVIVEAALEDHLRWNVCNLLNIEPGRVLMVAEAQESVARVRSAGVEVIEVPYSAFAQQGAGGIHRATMEIYRDPGPLGSDR